MLRTMMKSEIHAPVTGCDLHSVGSITVDGDLLETADIREFEQVTVLSINNGARFETYAVAAPRGSREVKVNGPAARLVHLGDTITVLSYALVSPRDLDGYAPRVVQVDADNVATELESGRATRTRHASSGNGTRPILELAPELPWRAA